MKRGKKAQAAITDNIILFATVFFFVIAMTFFLSKTLPTDFSDNRITAALITIGDEAIAVNHMGPGNKNTIIIDLPTSVETTKITSNTISLSKKGGINFTQKFDFNLVGDLPKNPGKHQIGITSVTGNVVKIGNGPYINSLVPNHINLTAIPLNMTILGEDLEDVDVRVVVPQSMGSWNISFSPFFHIIDNKKIILIINKSNPYGNFINPPGDPYYIYAKGNTEISNFVELNVIDDTFQG